VRAKHQRLLFVCAGLASLGGAAAFALWALQDKVTYFYTPSDLLHAQPAGNVRLGGLVADGSVARKADGLTMEFAVTDLKAQVPVRYTGIVPDLFREGQGVIAEGQYGPDGVFVARSLLAKHDEKYMPPEVAAALKKSGEWRDPAKPAS